jgi:lipoate-protein ligase A
VSGGWSLVRRRGTAGVLFGQPMPSSRTVVVYDVVAPALVLGSTQPLLVPSSSIEVVRRRSGGGAVLVGPEDVVWVDVFLPAGDPLWSHDVGRAFYWLGEAWAAALGVGSVHRGGLVTTPLSRVVCFAGVGPGEVVDGGVGVVGVDGGVGGGGGGGGGGKVVGMAQRRTRAGALFQCAVALRWDPERMAQLLSLGPEAPGLLAGAVRPVGPLTGDDAAMALLDHLP